MTEQAQIEEKIRQLLVVEISSVALSNKLFSPPDGLFCRLGPTEDERRVIIQSPLFREAESRLATLREKESAAFARAAEAFRAIAPPEGVRDQARTS